MAFPIAEILPYKLRVADISQTGWSGHSAVSVFSRVLPPGAETVFPPSEGRQEWGARHLLFLLSDAVSDSRFHPPLPFIPVE